MRGGRGRALGPELTGTSEASREDWGNSWLRARASIPAAPPPPAVVLLQRFLGPPLGLALQPPEAVSATDGGALGALGGWDQVQPRGSGVSGIQPRPLQNLGVGREVVYPLEAWVPCRALGTTTSVTSVW